MSTIIFCGADVHDKDILGRFGVGKEEPSQRSWRNTRSGRRALIRALKQEAKKRKAKKVIFAYEASGLGFGLYDDLTDEGIECHVLAPTKIRRSQKEKKNKTDPKDAQRVLEELRNHFLAGSELPSVWVPDMKTRDDRELVRARLDVASKITSVKTQVQSLLKRNRITKPKTVGKSWTVPFRRWLANLPDGSEGMGSGAFHALSSLLRQLDSLQEEEKRLNRQVLELSRTDQYREASKALQTLKGVALLTSMVFLTEMGDLSRFRNRRTIGSYLGLTPSAHESGDKSDRKGHITRLGSRRLRRVLCQAAWSRLRTDPGEKQAYEKIVKKNPKKRKIAVVALMRRLGIVMWHLGKTA